MRHEEYVPVRICQFLTSAASHAAQGLQPCALPTDTNGMGSRACLGATIALLCGACATESREPAVTTAPAISGHGAPAATSAEAASDAAVVPAPVREAPAPLPCYEITGTLAAAGRRWCILSVRLEERVSKAALRALWAALEAQQATEWDRFTCRVSVGADSWADVNEFAILETAREEADRPRAEPEADEEKPVVVEIGEDYVIYSFMGVDIKKSMSDMDDHTRHAWVRDLRTGEYKRVPVADLPRLSPRGSALDR